MNLLLSLVVSVQIHFQDNQPRDILVAQPVGPKDISIPNIKQQFFFLSTVMLVLQKNPLDFLVINP
jgi:hypothetical protein